MNSRFQSQYCASCPHCSCDCDCSCHLPLHRLSRNSGGSRHGHSKLNIVEQQEEQDREYKRQREEYLRREELENLREELRREKKKRDEACFNMSAGWWVHEHGWD